MARALTGGIAALAAAVWLATGTALADCAVPGDRVSVALDPGAARSGQPMALSWQAETMAMAVPPCAARYLVLALPDAVRLSGEGFLALAPGEAAPFDIGFAADRLRVIVPLHLPEAAQGRLEILPWLIGDFAAEWAEVHVPLVDPLPRQVAGERLEHRLQPGPPRVIVQDPFATDPPHEVVLSNSGQWRLEVFDGYYRVLDAETGALVHSGEGRWPQFSPTSRFLHAFGAGSENRDVEPTQDPDAPIFSDLTVIDLLTETEVLRIGREGWSGRGDFVTSLQWAPQDSFLTVTFEGNGGIAFQPMLVDRPLLITHNGCGACSAQVEGRAVVELENAFVDLGWAWSVDRASLLFPDRVNDGWDDATAWQPPHPALVPPRLAEPDHNDAEVDWDAAERVFHLAGPVRTSYEDPWRGLPDTTVQHRPLTLAQVAPLPEAPAAMRGAELLASATAVNQASRMALRLADLGLVAQAPAALRHDRLLSLAEAFWQEVEALPEDADWPDPPEDWLDEYGHYFDVGTALLSRGAVSSEQAEALTRAVLAATEDSEHCIVTPALHADLWTLPHHGGLTGLLHYHCRVGTGYAPEGVLVGLRLDRDGVRARVVAVAPDYDALDAAGLDPDDPASWSGPVGVQGPLRAFRLSEAVLAFAGVEGRVTLYDLDADAVLRDLLAIPAPAQIAELSLLQDGRHVLQVNGDGRFFVHGLDGGGPALSGLYLDDEIVVHDAELNFEATPEGARYVHLKFPGDRHLHALDQLGARLGGRPVVATRLSGAALAAPALPIPPRLEEVAATPGHVTVRAVAPGGLADVTLYRDGVALARRAVAGPQAELSFELPARSETRWFALRVRDGAGLESRAHLIAADPAGEAAPEARLFALAVGIDRYADPAISDLNHAAQDAQAFVAALHDGLGRLYADVHADPLTDPVDLRGELPARLAAIRAQMTRDDTLFLHLAGHGFLDAQGALHLAGGDARLDDLAMTALPWADVVAELAAMPGRVVVFLDVCHSGAAGVATNDDAVSGLLAQSGTPIAVLAASKGRQPSFESASLGGGAFTAALVRALSDPAVDLDGNGAVELSELYAAVKRDVVLATQGRQTPWIARSAFVGEVPLY